MPTIDKQGNNPPRRVNDLTDVMKAKVTSGQGLSYTSAMQGLSDDVLAVYESIGRMQAPEAMQITVYGRLGTGKTQLACTFPKPILLIGVEDGTSSVYNIKGVDFKQISTTREFEALTTIVSRRIPSRLWKEPYKTVVLDTAGGLQDMILYQNILGVGSVPLSRNWGEAQKGDWQAVAAQIKDILSPFLNLSKDKSVKANIVILAHERDFGGDSNSDVIIPAVGPALSPAVAGWLCGECDNVCQAYHKRKEIITKETVDVAGVKEEIETKVLTNDIEFCLRTRYHPNYMVRLRMPIDNQPPLAIANPTYEKIKSIIDGKVQGKSVQP